MVRAVEYKLKPNLRFKEFNNYWTDKFINEILTIGSGKDHKHLGDGRVPLYGSGGLMRYVDNFLYDGESVCIGRKGTIDKPIYLNDKFWTVDTLFYTHSFKGVYPKFVYALFQNINWYKYNEASGVPSLSKSTIEKIKLYIPSLSEQIKIASFLSLIDIMTEKLIKKKELIKEYKKGAIQQFLSLKTRSKDSDNNDYPDWELIKLGDKLEHRSERNKSNKVQLVLSVSNKKGFISQQEQFDGYKVASKDVSNYKIVKEGEYAYNPSRINVGSIARLDNFEQGIVSPMYVVFKLKKNLNPLFFDAVISSHRFKHLIKIGCSGSVRDSLNFDEMEKFEIKLPCIEEQQKIANFLCSLDNKIDLVNAQIEKTKAFKKGLLQQMFV